MADGLLTRREPRRRVLPKPLAVRWRLMPWWLKVLFVYAAARITTTILMLALATVQGPNAWTGAHPPYGAFANIWDGRWYEIIALSGYPTSLPVTDGGHIGENAWAFLPVYPFLVRGLMVLTGLPWEVLAIGVSVVAGFCACLAFHRLLLPRIGASAALFAVALFAFAPTSPLFQVAYAESLHLLMLVLALLLLSQRRYGLLAAVTAVMAFTRPSGLAFALTLGLYFAYRYVHRRTDPFAARERIEVAAVTAVSLIAGFAWLVLAGVVTGDWSAYTDTELAWRMPYIGYVELVPFTAWFQGAQWWLAFIGVPDAAAWVLGSLGIVALIAAFAGMLFLPAVRRIGVESRLWLASYGLYLLAVFFPQSSTFRLLTPMFPLLGAIAQPRSRLYRGALLVLSVVLQAGWLLLCWAIGGYDWSPP
ncbi:MAG: hypothetical protein ABWY36_00395 [Leifsonia sp.]